jgi:hypothetical protein
LEADIALKQLALGLLPTEIWGLQSYFALSTAYAREQGKDEHVCSRFWYYPLNPSIAVRDGVFALGELLVGVRTQVMCVNGQSITGLTAARDPLGDTFAESLTAHYRDLSIAYPAIGRLQVLFDLVALARGIQLLPSAPDLSYWLQTYPVARVETPQTHPLLKQQAKLPASDHTKMLEIDGGVQLKALVLRLQDGDITALRDAVLLSRPQGQVLTWRVPLEGWRLPAYWHLRDSAPQYAGYCRTRRASANAPPHVAVFSYERAPLRAYQKVSLADLYREDWRGHAA